MFVHVTLARPRWLRGNTNDHFQISDTVDIDVDTVDIDIPYLVDTIGGNRSTVSELLLFFSCELVVCLPANEAV